MSQNFTEIAVKGSSSTAIIDTEDLSKVSGFNWRLHPKGYVYATFWMKGRMHHVYLHRLVTGVESTEQCDHAHHNKLDNRKSELRTGTASQNQGNRRKLKTASSGFKGVSWHSRKNKWIAYLRLRVGGKRKLKHLGYFDTQDEAARAYNKAAGDYFGSFSNQNAV